MAINMLCLCVCQSPLLVWNQLIVFHETCYEIYGVGSQTNDVVFNFLQLVITVVIGGEIVPVN
jgi:hypothetical protein